MPPAIQFEQVSRRYGRVVALERLDLSVPAGCLFGLIGKSGAGKTTTLQILLGLIRASAGRSWVLQTRSRQIARLAGRVGVTLDRPALHRHLTVREHLSLHARAHGRRAPVDETLERVDLAGLGRHKAAGLSAGERQRLALARALLLRPEVLVLDEPLVHLDPHLAARLLDVLREEVGRGATVLLSSHQLAYLERVADRLALIHQGRLLLEGSTADLLHRGDSWLQVQARPAHRVEQVLGQHPLVAEVVRAEGPEGFRVRLTEARPEEINKALHDAGIAVAALAPERARLDDLFLRATREGDQGR